jgi:hypothetical protein
MEPVEKEILRSNLSKLWTREEYYASDFSKQTVKGKVGTENVSNANHSMEVIFKGARRCLLVKDAYGKVIKSPSYSPAKIIL